MRVRAGVGGAAAALALTATAVAQVPAPVPPIGNFGGGFVRSPPRDPLTGGNVVLGMRATAGGKLRIEATVPGRCGGGTFPARANLADDGRFVAKGTSRRSPEAGLRLETKYRITGTLTPNGIDDGTARAETEIRTRGQRTVRCKSGTVDFRARRPVGGIGTPGTEPKARYYGVTSEKRNNARRGIVLRISDGGKFLERALYAVTLRCGKLVFPDVLDTPRRNVPLDAQGRFSDAVSDTIREARTVTRTEERFSGTLGSTGAEGTLSITERTRSRKTGKLLETCRTGSVKWTAAR